MEKTILVLGGGIGGIRTARELNKLIGNDEDAVLAKILVFEKEKTSLFAPSLTWMMVGKREMYQIQDNLTSIEPQRCIERKNVQRRLYGRFSWHRSN